MITLSGIPGEFAEQYKAIVNQVLSPRNVPDTVYHYTSANGLNAILSSETLWFTRRDCLNDPTEHQHIHDVIKLCLSSFKADKAFKRHLNSLNEQLLSMKNPNSWFTLDKNVYIASFSTNGDSIPMWMNYTKSSHCDGYSIGFDTSILKEKDSAICISPVLYDFKSKEKIVNHFLDLLHVIWKQKKDSSDELNNIKNKIKMASMLFTSEVGCFFKHPDYEYEKEARIILRIKSKDKRIKIRTSNGFLIPYVPLPFEKKMIKSVTSSPTLNESIASVGIQAAAERYGYHINVCHSNRPLRNI